jgi:hypothetical protein
VRRSCPRPVQDGLSLETLVTKAKPSGAVKYRLIIDLLRSGGNGLAKIPKRIVLPRVQDVVKDIQELWQQYGGQDAGADWGMELGGRRSQ